MKEDVINFLIFIGSMVGMIFLIFLFFYILFKIYSNPELVGKVFGIIYKLAIDWYLGFKDGFILGKQLI